MNDMDEFFWIVIVVVVGVHIAFGIISAVVASKKGRDSDLGFLAGFLLNVFGLIIVMLMRPSVEVEARRRIEVEQEYELQRQSVPVSNAYTTDTEPTRRATVSIQRARYGDVTDLRVIVLSAPDQRARGAVILTSEAVAGALYFWPEENTGIVRFLNLYSSIEMCVAIVDTAGTIEEFLTLDAGDDSSIEPTNPIGSAIAFPADRFKDIEIDIGDRVVLPRELRPLIWSSE